jgi:hypothetical protein
MLTAPDRLDVITDIAMIPGTKNSMNLNLLARIDVSDDLMNGGSPDIPWFTAPSADWSICIFGDTELELAS